MRRICRYRATPIMIRSLLASTILGCVTHVSAATAMPVAPGDFEASAIPRMGRDRTTENTMASVPSENPSNVGIATLTDPAPFHSHETNDAADGGSDCTVGRRKKSL